MELVVVGENIVVVGLVVVGVKIVGFEVVGVKAGEEGFSFIGVRLHSKGVLAWLHS